MVEAKPCLDADRQRKTFTECFREVYGKYREDEKVVEMFRRVSPSFPQPGLLYDYLDLVEHIRGSLTFLCTCDPDRIPEYHLVEIFKRRAKLLEEVPKLVRAGVIRDWEYDRYMSHMDWLLDEWGKDFKKFFLACTCGGR